MALDTNEIRIAALKALCVIGDGSPEYDPDCNTVETYLNALEAQNAALVEALTALSNNIVGVIGYAEPEIRSAIGNTNLAVIRHHLKMAETALTLAAASK